MSITLAAADTITGVAGSATSITYTIFGDEVTTGDAFKVLAQGQLPSTVGTLYTVPGATSAIVKGIHLVNGTGGSVTAALNVKGTAAANAILPAITILAGGFAVFGDDGWQVYNSQGQLLSVGATGATGSAGSTGATGSAGSTGATGATGGSAQLASITAASSAIANTETVVVSASLAGGYVTAGMSFRLRAAGVGTTGLTPGADTFRARIGTTTLTGNIPASVQPTANASVSAQPFEVEIFLTCRTAGSGGTIIGEARVLSDNITTGLFPLLVDVETTTATVALNTTVTNLLELTFQSGSAGSSCTFHLATIESLNVGASGGAFANPMTTKGDLILGDTGGTATRLGASTSTYVLTSNGAAAFPSWQAAGGGGGSDLVNVASGAGSATIPGLKGSPDAVPGSPGAADDEFDTTSTFSTTLGSLDTNNTTDFPSHLHLKKTTSSTRIDGVYKAKSGAFTMTCKVADAIWNTATAAQYPWLGLLLTESSPGKCFTFGILNPTASGSQADWSQWANNTTRGTFADAILYSGNGALLPYQYFRIIVTASNNVALAVSRTGFIYQTLFSGIDTGLTIANAGLFITGYSAITMEAVFDWVRFT